MKNNVSFGATANRLKLLFVNTTESDTQMLTKGLQAEVIRADRVENAKATLQREKVDGIFVDVSSLGAAEVAQMQSRTPAQTAWPLVLLTDLAGMPHAIEQVKHGAHGFLVKGVSTSASLVNLMRYANQKPA